MPACFPVTFLQVRLFGTLAIFTLLQVRYFNKTDYYISCTCRRLFSLTLNKSKCYVQKCYYFLFYFLKTGILMVY